VLFEVMPLQEDKHEGECFFMVIEYA
jgi:hypothetical protein